MKFTPRQWARRMSSLLEVPTPDPPQLRRRIEIVERDLVLPVKAAGVVMLVCSFLFSPWFGVVSNTLDVAVESLQYFFWAYVTLNVGAGTVILFMRRLPLAVIQWVVFSISLMDGAFLSGLTIVSGGYDSILFWVLVGLIVRNAASTAPALLQLILNGSIILFYVLAGVLDVTVSQNVEDMFNRSARQTAGPELPEHSAETLLIRLAVMVLTTLCCYALQVLLEKQRLALEEEREFSVREGQLRSAGRLAAEIAHQIKNPLAIINNAAFSLRRALQEGKGETEKQIQIIQEEVERSDRILTELMGYAQLSEGRVEKVSVADELDRAIERVFPPAANYPVKVQRDYGGQFPPLLMQRSHLSEALVNLLQNARDAMIAGGGVHVSARLRSDNSIEITIRDEGPGIPADKIGKIFEAYYTTKPKGTGLGLAIVKHNVELYGGAVHVESKLGNGSKFVITFPAKSLVGSAGAA